MGGKDTRQETIMFEIADVYYTYGTDGDLGMSYLTLI